MGASMRKRSDPRVLVVAPGHGGRGGIDSVVRMYQSTRMWDAMNCRLLATYDDRSALHKILAALKGYMAAPAAILRADIVHVHLAGEISFLRKMPVLFLAKALRRRLILHVHACSEQSLFDKTPRWAWSWALGQSDCVIALSPSWAETIMRHAPEVRVVVVSNPVGAFSSVPRPHASPRVLYVGKLERRKGFDTLLASVPIVLQEFPEVEFWFAGHGELETARSQAEALGISHSVRLLGWVQGSELQAIYDAVDVFCLPSHNEGVPMSMLEAMSRGLPVVCTPVGGVPDVIVDQVNGVLVEPGSAESIAAGILCLLRNPEWAACIARFGRETVETTCSLERVVDQMTTLYEELAASMPGAQLGVGHGI